MYRGTSGRGPMRVMSPFSTLTSCGSSSSLVARSTAPSLVTRESAWPVTSGSARSAPLTIERSFKIVNGSREPAYPDLPVERRSRAGESHGGREQRR